MCCDPNCKFKRVSELAFQYSRLGNYSARCALEAALRDAGYDVQETFFQLGPEKAKSKTLLHKIFGGSR